MRAATETDRPVLEAFLAARAERSMFALSNLLAHGMEGGHPRAMRFWLAGEPVEGVLGLTGEGFVLPAMPAAMAGEAASVLAGKSVIGFAGEEGEIAALRAAMGLEHAPTRLADAEPQFALDLAALRMPSVTGLALAPLGEAPRELMIDWAEAYEIEALGAAPEAAREEARRDVADWAEADSHRVLWRGRRPVARTGFNARVAGMVQVGAVYVPPDLRGQGLARAAVALHLAEARAEGVRRATLFSASEAASRAYQAIGFERIGDDFLCLLDGPRVAGGGPWPEAGPARG